MEFVEGTPITRFVQRENVIYEADLVSLSKSVQRSNSRIDIRLSIETSSPITYS
jgi:hypothetical protein